MLLELLVCQRSSYHSVRFSLTTSSSTLLVRYSTLKRCARSHRRCRCCRCDLVELSCRQLSCISYLCRSRSKSSYRRRKSRNPVFVEKKKVEIVFSYHFVVFCVYVSQRRSRHRVVILCFCCSEKCLE